MEIKTDGEGEREGMHGMEIGMERGVGGRG